MRVAAEQRSGAPPWPVGQRGQGAEPAGQREQDAEPAGARSFWGLVVITGLVAGLGAVGLEQLRLLIQALVWPAGDGLLAQARAAPASWRLGVLGGAGLLVTSVSLLARRPLGGHGTAHILETIWAKAGQMPLGRTLAHAVLSIVAVAMGVSLGREGALIQTGAASGAFLGRGGRLSASQLRLLVACGAAAGMAAAYNAPLGAAIFALEVFLGSFALELLAPVALSTAVATLVARALLGDHAVYLVPEYELIGMTELWRALPVGAAVGIASALFVGVVDAAPRLAARAPRPVRFVLPIGATLLVGLIATRFPEVLGNGYDTVDEALNGRVPLLLLCALPALKLLATAACSGTGVPGGLFTPSLFFGGLVGAATGALLEQLSPIGVPPGAWALLGMAAVLAGTTHTLASAVLLVFELTGEYGFVVPLMVASVVAALVSRALNPHSLYTAGLRRRNLSVELPRPEWLRVTRVESLLRSERHAVGPVTAFSDLVMRLLSAPENDLYVTGGDGRLLGIISLGALKAHLADEPHLPMVVAADVMDRTTAPLRPGAPLSQAAARFAESGLERLPVVDAGGRLLGSVRRADVLRQGRY